MYTPTNGQIVTLTPRQWTRILLQGCPITGTATAQIGALLLISEHYPNDAIPATLEPSDIIAVRTALQPSERF